MHCRAQYVVTHIGARCVLCSLPFLAGSLLDIYEHRYVATDFHLIS